MNILRFTLRIITISVSIGALAGCREADLTLTPTRATIGYTTAAHKDLISLPEPKSKVVVAVYKFRDQTGQYKTSSQATTFSTAVTQGATSLLNKALEDSGWFMPIEREGLANLLNERKIISSTRMQAQGSGGAKVSLLPPLLYAGVLLEGGIIGYDSNFVTGGLGVRYFGVGGSGQIRKDRITIYLRLVSTQNGQVLKSVSTTKTVLSKEVDFNVYRYVSVNRLFEFETGLSTNEPVTVCVLEAIEKAVHDLIVEGIQDRLWALENPEDINSPAVQNYFKEKEQVEKLVAFDKEGKLVKVEDIEEPGKVVEPPVPELVSPMETQVPKEGQAGQDPNFIERVDTKLSTILDRLSEIIGEIRTEPEIDGEEDKDNSVRDHLKDVTGKPFAEQSGEKESKPVSGEKSESQAEEEKETESEGGAGEGG